MKLKKSLAILLALVMVLSMLTACGGGGSDDGEEGLDLVIQQTTELSTMDGSMMTIASHMEVFLQTMEGLYTYNNEGVVVPGMAESVDISEDGLTYTFTIRDALWSNGDPVTAHDFEYSWKRLANPETGAEYAWMLGMAGVKNGDAVAYDGAPLDSLGVKAVDDKTLVVELDRPVPYFPSMMTGSYFMPINQKFCEECGDQYGLDMEHIIANGPFVVSQWTPGDMEVVCVPNESYYNAENIPVNSLTFRTIKDNQQAIMSWESGDLDATGLSGEQIQNYTEDPAFVSVSENGVKYIMVNHTIPELANKNLRLAIAYAIDKDEIVDGILKNGSMPANYLVPVGFAPDANGVTFREAANAEYLHPDKELAKQYYDAACAELGKSEFTFELLYDNNEMDILVAQFLQSELQNTLPGVTIELKVQPKNNRVELMQAGEFELCLAGWYADYQDATTFLDMWLIGSSNNSGEWVNEEYDALERSVSTAELGQNPEERVARMIQAEKILLDDAGIIPVYQMNGTYLVNPDYHVVHVPVFGFLWQYVVAK